jgi:integrase
LKEKVELPKKRAFQDEALEPEVAKRIILACKNETLKLILLLMKDTLARPTELLGLQLMHFNLAHDPPYLTIPSYLAKNDIAREVFFTNETKQILIDYLKNKNITKPEQFIFINEIDPIGDEEGFQLSIKRELNVIEDAWAYMMRKPALKEIRKTVQQKGKMKRYSIHIYSFKKYGFTKIADALGSLTAHAIAGHEEYLITYYKKSRAERAEDYRKVMPKLNLFTMEEEEKLKEKAKSIIEALPREALLEILEIGKKALKE